MPANTPNGLPYPVGTDRVMDGDDAIHALATALKICCGTATLPAGTGTRTVAVTFPAGLYATPPNVAANNTISSYVNVATASVTASGFTMQGVYRVSSGAAGDLASPAPCGWIAALIG